MDNNDINEKAKNDESSSELQSLISNAIEKKKEKELVTDSSNKDSGQAGDIKFKPKTKPVAGSTDKTNLKKAAPASKTLNASKSHPKKQDNGQQQKKAAKNDSVRQKTQADKKDKADDKKAEKPVNKPNKRKWSVKKKTGVTLGIIFLVFIIILAVIVGIFLHYTGLLDRDGDTQINSGAAPLNSSDWVDKQDTFDAAEKEEELRKELEKNSTKISSEDVINILLIGEDIRDTEGKDRGNTDVMMIISLNSKQKTITMTSLMRDMYIYMSRFGDSGKLNAAYWHGGAEYLEEVIEDYYGIEIDRYVKVNFNQFIDVVEAVGGLDLTVAGNEAYAMDDPLAEQNHYLGYDKGTDYLDKDLFPTEDTKVDLHLNGNQSLAYARIRYNCGDDYGRTQRQRIVIKEVIKKSKNLSFFDLDKLINKVFPNVETNITDGEIASLLLNAFDYMKYDVQELRIPADGYFTDEVINNMEVLNFDIQANAAIIQNVIYGDASNVEQAIEIYQEQLADGTFYDNNQQVMADGYNNGYGYGGY